MLNELQKKAKKSVVISAILLFIIGIALTIPFFRNIQSYIGDGLPLKSWHRMKSKLVCM